MSMSYLPDIGIFIIICAVLVALAWWNGRTPSKLQNTLLGVGAILGSWTLALALLGYFVGFAYEIPLLLSVIFLWVVPWKSTFEERQQALISHAQHFFSFFRKLRGVKVLLCAYLAIIFAITFILSLAPPSGGDYDSLVYHLSVPARYLLEGKIIALPYDHHSYFPMTMEMLYLGGLQLTGPVLAKLFHWLMLPLSCLTLVAIGDALKSRRSGLWAAAIFTAIPLMLFESVTAYVDLGLIFFSLVAFLCLFNWLKNSDTKWLIWCGIFGGFCLGIKYSGVFIPFWIGLWLLGAMATRRKWQFAGIGMYILAIFLVGGFWYAKNAVQTHNPVFPFAYSVFGGEGWTEQMAEAYNTDQREYGYGRKPLDWAMLPWRLSMAPLNNITTTEYGPALVAQPFWPFSSTELVPEAGVSVGRFDVLGLLTQSVLGPILLALCIPLIFVRRKPTIVGIALWSFLFFILLWAIGSQQIRYLMAPAALLCVAAGWMVDFSLQRGAILKWTTLVAVGICCLFSPIYVLAQSKSTFPVILGKATPQRYLSRTFPGYNAMDWANKNTPEDAIFAIYGEPRCFYLHKKYFWADEPHNTLIDYSQIHSGAELVEALHERGASYILWNVEPGRTGGVFGPPLEIGDAIDYGLLEKIHDANGYEIYQIVER